MVRVQKKALAQLSCFLCFLTTIFKKSRRWFITAHVLLLTKGYDVASGQPVAGQERNQDSKANQREEEVQQPGNNLEKVQGPAPAVPSSTLGLHLRKTFA